MDIVQKITQQQKQIATQEIMQIVEYLQIPEVDLIKEIVIEASENPAIELENTVESDRIKPIAEDDPDKKEFEENRNKKENSEDEEVVFQDSSDLGFDKPIKKRKSNSDFDSQAYLENLSVDTPTLQEHLHEQLLFADLSEEEWEIANSITYSLDEHGYFHPEGVNTSFDQRKVEKIREMIQQLDPIGIASKNLQEFLKTQAVYEFGTNSLEYTIIDEHIDLVEKKLHTKLASAMNVTLDEIENAINNIRTLRMFPAMNFTTQTTQYVAPIAKVFTQNGEVVVTMFDDNIPNIIINKDYEDKSKECEDKRRKERMELDIRRGKELKKYVEIRKNIMKKVVHKIVEKQRDFFLKGERYQIPLTQKDIGDELEISESTVSRAIQDKYIQTDNGIISLKSLFSSNVGTDDTSSSSIKNLIADIIEAEDKDSPLSDDRIVGILKNKGLIISRRTATKYRNELKIPPAYMRRNPI